jgi:aspartyl-tRNA synthetase
MNGAEVGGGSVRIHNAELQKHVLDILNLPLGSLVRNSLIFINYYFLGQIC